MDEQGQRLREALAGRYAVDEEIGSGGMATVYLADELKHHRKVAVKVLRPELAAALGAARFVREIEIAAQLSHPHILPLFDSGEADGLLYYVAPYVHGGSLRSRLQQDGRLALVEAMRIVRDVGAALDYAHREGFVHRDVKPENILFADGHAVLADFWIARALTTAVSESITDRGVVVGTPGYMSPEQVAAIETRTSSVTSSPAQPSMGVSRTSSRVMRISRSSSSAASRCVSGTLRRTIAGHASGMGPVGSSTLKRSAKERAR
jgi:serine/threonine-protein kinase